MAKKTYDKEDLRKKHAQVCPSHARLAMNLKQALETFLDDAGIDVLDIDYRIKDFESFWDKIERKGYKRPLQQTEDICGVRIICFYPSDLEKIAEIITSEFNVRESIDKTDQLEVDRFGYRSHHFIVTVKKKWLGAPNYRGLGNLKAEVQVRTILMHAWADIQQKLAYKREQHVPDLFRRKLSRISAQLEAIDEDFDSLRKEREEYTKYLVSDEAKMTGRFDVTQEMNLDSLQALLDFYCPNRRKSLESTSEVLDEIAECHVSIREVVEAFEKARDILPLIETDIRKAFKWERSWDLSQVGAARWVLDLTVDKYWEYRMADIGRPAKLRREKWRARLSDQNR